MLQVPELASVRVKLRIWGFYPPRCLPALVPAAGVTCPDIRKTFGQI